MLKILLPLKQQYLNILINLVKKDISTITKDDNVKKNENIEFIID